MNIEEARKELDAFIEAHDGNLSNPDVVKKALEFEKLTMEL